MLEYGQLPQAPLPQSMSPTHAPLGPLAAALLAFAPTAPAAQVPEDPGPQAVGWQDVTFPSSLGGTLTGRVYYPAITAGENRPPDTLQAPYPLASFHHGLGLGPSDYDDVCSHAASWGFVLLSIETDYPSLPPGTTYQDMILNQASYAADMFAWMEGESADSGSQFFGLASSSPYTAIGHSMGGASLSHVFGRVPQVQNLLALEPDGLAIDTAGLAGFTGNVLVVGGSADVAVDPYPFFTGATSASRDLFVELQGAGHTGSTDMVVTTEPMSAADQKRLHKRYIGGFLRAQVKGEEELYLDLLGEGISAEPVLAESASDYAPFWVAPSALTANTLLSGIAATPFDAAAFGVSPGPASIPSPWGTIGIQITGSFLVYASFTVEADGITELQFPIPANLAGQTLWFQGFALGADHALLTEVAVTTMP